MITKKTIKNIAATSSNKFYDNVIISLPIYKSDVVNPFTENRAKKDIGIKIQNIISKADSLLKKSGYLFIYGSPVQLIEAYKKLPTNLRFRYWIAVDVVDSTATPP